MELEVHNVQKQVHIWLTNAEKQNPAVETELKRLYQVYREKQYLVAVFLSGSQELRQGMRDLLAYNKKRCAQLAVQRQRV
ncbi:MAG TPA: hypothetical protein H9841_09925 [Candidatus Flavonifractor merdigallinarum]|uniref:Uncharacterized protein n=1 Tax=Candidatus Flavonifractor merdigallinarum TaxID=2838589 RepID=A0A9D1YAD6_9FIRM|nr:hypothetical protein [Candidatus Flavonifractor merdigallinarum]